MHYLSINCFCIHLINNFINKGKFDYILKYIITILQQPNGPKALGSLPSNTRMSYQWS